MPNGLATLPSRKVFRGAAGGYQPDWVAVTDQLGASIGSQEDIESGLTRLAPLTGQPLTLTSLFFVMRIRDQAQTSGSDGSSSTRYFWGDPVTAFYGFSVGGGQYLNHKTRSIGCASGSGPRVSPGVFDPPFLFNSAHGYVGNLQQRETIFAFSLNGVTGDMKTAVFQWGWQNPVPQGGAGGLGDQDPVYPTAGMDYDATYWHIFGYNYGYQGQAAYVWFNHADDASAYVDVHDPAVQRELEGNPEDWTFATPAVWFQGDAAEWNSGVNRGSGGDFVSAGNITDVLRTH